MKGRLGLSCLWLALGSLLALTSLAATPGSQRVGLSDQAMASAVTAGDSYTCAIVAGSAKCWGENGYGQLGDGTFTPRLSPVQVKGLTSGVVALTAGAGHACALITGGSVQCWGNNQFGQLGDGTTLRRLAPVQVQGLTHGVAAIGAGEFHTCALLAEGAVSCWGWNDEAQIGDGLSMTYLTPTAIKALPAGVKALAVGNRHNCVVAAGGRVSCWGGNWESQLGDGTTTRRRLPGEVSGLTGGFTALAAGDTYTCALDEGGAVKCWGENSSGQLGDGTLTSRRAPVAVSGLPGLASALTAGSAHTCALVTDGSAWCWGANWYGALGDGTTTDRLVPVAVSGLETGLAAVTAGDAHTCVLTREGRVKCWGSNTFGQLGDGTNHSRPWPVDVVDLLPALAAGPASAPAASSPPSPTVPATTSPPCGSLTIGILAAGAGLALRQRREP